MASVAFHFAVAFGSGLSTANSSVLESQIQYEVLDGANTVRIPRNAPTSPGFVEQYDGNGTNPANKTTGTYEYTGTVDDSWPLPLKIRYTINNPTDGLGLCLIDVVGNFSNAVAATAAATSAATSAASGAASAASAATSATSAASASAAVKLQTDKFSFTGTGPYQVNSNATVSGSVVLDSTQHALIADDVQAAMDAQGYSTGRAGFLDTLNGLVGAIWTHTVRTVTNAWLGVSSASGSANSQNNVQTVFYLGQGDVEPAYSRILNQPNGQPYDLTGKTIYLRIWRADGAADPTLPAPPASGNQVGISIDDATHGAVSYTWQGTENLTAGRYYARWRIMDSNLAGAHGLTLPLPRPDIIVVKGPTDA